MKVNGEKSCCDPDHCNEKEMRYSAVVSITAESRQLFLQLQKREREEEIAAIPIAAKERERKDEIAANPIAVKFQVNDLQRSNRPTQVNVVHLNIGRRDLRNNYGKFQPNPTGPSTKPFSKVNDLQRSNGPTQVNVVHLNIGRLDLRNNYAKFQPNRTGPCR